jgi:hypothetical protein
LVELWQLCSHKINNIDKIPHMGDHWAIISNLVTQCKGKLGIIPNMPIFNIITCISIIKFPDVREIGKLELFVGAC